MPTNTEILTALATQVPQLIAKVDKLQASVDAISASGTTPAAALKAAFKAAFDG